MEKDNELYSAANISGFTYRKYTTSKNDNGEFVITFHDVKESGDGIQIGSTVCEEKTESKNGDEDDKDMVYVDKYIFQLLDEVPFSTKHVVVTDDKKDRTIKIYKIFYLVKTDRITSTKFALAVSEYFEFRPPITGYAINSFLRTNIKKELDVLKEVLFSDKMTDGERFCVAFDYFFHE
uniref:START domain-containing protein n=1 Tax=Strongyloides papillosus TaxID=174720 RepID=A0A0N5BYE8_STREA